MILLDLDIDELLMDFCMTMFNIKTNCDGWADDLKHEDIPTCVPQKKLSHPSFLVPCPLTELASRMHSLARACRTELIKRSADSLLFLTYSFNAFNLLGVDIMRLFRQMSKGNPRVGTHLALKYRDRLTSMCLWLAYISEVTWNVADAIQMMFNDNEGMHHVGCYLSSSTERMCFSLLLYIVVNLQEMSVV